MDASEGVFVRGGELGLGGGSWWRSKVFFDISVRLGGFGLFLGLL